MTRKFKWLSAALLIAAASVPQAQAQEFIRIGSGVGGTLAVYGAKLAEVINNNVEGVMASTVAGSTESSIVKMEQGELELALSYTFFSEVMRKGEGSTGIATPSIRHLMTTYGSVYSPIIRKGAPVSSLSQLKETAANVGIGQTTSVFYGLNVASLAAAGVALEDIPVAGGVLHDMSYAAVAPAVQAGQIDVAFMGGPVPYSLLMQIQDDPGFAIVGYDEGSLAAMEEALPGVSGYTLPAGTYTGQENDETIIYLLNQVVISDRVSDDVAYRIAKAMNENASEFHELFAGASEIATETALANNVIAVHPGAERYYREVGLMAD